MNLGISVLTQYPNVGNNLSGMNNHTAILRSTHTHNDIRQTNIWHDIDWIDQVYHQILFDISSLMKCICVRAISTIKRVLSH